MYFDPEKHGFDGGEKEKWDRHECLPHLMLSSIGPCPATTDLRL